ncbi:MAG: metallophosphoesterase family protein [Caldicoprobacterales bacterium]|jgi:exonuclease SbcD|nr:DNA repair exonuclease [Clostridiales bacterium]
MVGIKFIHTADIHLGSLLHIGGGKLPPAVEQAAVTATMEGFSRVCHAAIKNRVDFVVISGDLYDREARSVRAMSFFAEKCRLLEEAGIPVLVIAGNHDPLKEKQDLIRVPDNVKVLSGDRPEIVEIPGSKGDPIARVIGQSYQSGSLDKGIHYDYKVPDRDLWNIALLHTQLEAPSSRYIPCSLTQLREIPDIHYWALGHIHRYRDFSDDLPYIAYPGIPQGRDFGETGRGGCILANLDPFGQSQTSFIPLAPVIYKRVEINIDDDPTNVPGTLLDLVDRICLEGDRLLEETGDDEDYPIEGYVVEWTIRGRGAIHSQLMEQEQESMEFLLNSLREQYEGSSPFLWTDSIIIRTQSPIDYIDLLENSPVFREVDRIIDQCLEDEDMRERLMDELGIIWKGDGDHETENDLRFHMDDASLREILYRARYLIAERLTGRGEGS